MIKTLLQNCYHLHLHWWVGNQIFCCLILKRDIFCWSWIYWPNINTLPSNSRHKSRNFDISSDDDKFPKINMRRTAINSLIFKVENHHQHWKTSSACCLTTLPDWLEREDKEGQLGFETTTCGVGWGWGGYKVIYQPGVCNVMVMKNWAFESTHSSALSSNRLRMHLNDATFIVWPWICSTMYITLA